MFTLLGVTRANAQETGIIVTFTPKAIADVVTEEEAPLLPQTGPNLYPAVLAMAQSDQCGLPQDARIYFLGLIRTESNFRQFDENGNAIINEIGAVGISQLFTDVTGRTDAPYHYTAEIKSLSGNLLEGCKHFRSDWINADGNPRLAIARYKGFAFDPNNTLVSEALCFAETRLTGPCLRD